MAGVPYTFGSATTSIPLSQLDSNFTIGTTTVALGNTTTTLAGLTSVATNTLTSAAATALTLQSAGSTAIFVDTGQNVGIGTTSPLSASQLTVASKSLSITGSDGNFSGSGARTLIDFASGAARIGYVDGGTATAGSLNFITSPGSSGGINRAQFDSSGNFFPNADNAYSVGKSGNRWSAIWAANGTIQTSDANAKTDIVNTPLGLSFIASLRPVAYKYKIGGNIVTGNPDDPNNPTITPIVGKRQHFGLIAQEVKAALPEGVDFAGWAVTDLENPNSEQGLRYDQFIAPMIKAIQEQQALITALTARITALESK